MILFVVSNLCLFFRSRHSILSYITAINAHVTSHFGLKLSLFLYTRMPVQDTGYPFKQISEKALKLRHVGLPPQPFQIQYSLFLPLFHAA